MAGAAGVEPTSAVLETVILPLNYAPISMTNKLYHIKYILYTYFIYTYNILGDFMGLIKYTTKERDNLARLMRAEAIDEGELGMLMVGNVGVNRALASCYTFKNIRTINDMIFQNPGGFAGINSSLFFSSPTTKEKQLANRVLKGEYYHPTTNALWFYAPEKGKVCSTSWWYQPFAGKFKNHCFYKPKSGECK